MASQFTNPNGSISTSAMLEQCSCIAALYYNRRDLAQAILDQIGTYTISAWQWNDTSLPPSWFVWHDANDIFVNVTGTVNRNQFIADCVGYLGTPYPNSDARVNFFFYLMAQNIKPQIIASFPSPIGNRKIHVSGHSYGGAVSWILAQKFAQVYGANNVEFMGFGTPKIVTSTGNMILPSVCRQVENVGDFVPYLPPSLLTFAASGITSPITSIALDYSHFATISSLDSAGRINPTLSGLYDTLLSLSPVVGTIYRHPIGSYATNCIAAYQRSNP